MKQRTVKWNKREQGYEVNKNSVTRQRKTKEWKNKNSGKKQIRILELKKQEQRNETNKSSRIIQIKTVE